MRKSVRGNVISDAIAQINAVLVPAKKEEVKAA